MLGVCHGTTPGALWVSGAASELLLLTLLWEEKQQVLWVQLAFEANPHSESVQHSSSGNGFCFFQIDSSLVVLVHKGSIFCP